jgi:hypothetical protein
MSFHTYTLNSEIMSDSPSYDTISRNTIEKDFTQFGLDTQPKTHK